MMSELPHPVNPEADPILDRWSWHLSHLAREEFTKFMLQEIANRVPAAMDRNGIAEIPPEQIQTFCFGEWQSVHAVDTCTRALLNVLNLNPGATLLNQPDLDAILLHGNIPDKWGHTSRCPFAPHSGPLDEPYLCGIWHDGDNHFVVIYICKHYWSILDPLHAQATVPPGMGSNV